MTFEGIGLPINGEFYRYKNDQTTQTLFVENDGVMNIAVTKSTASTTGDNIVAITLTDEGTVTSGYSQGFYVDHKTTGSYSGGGAQINSFAVDLALGGVVGCEAEGMYVYIYGSSTPTLTSANISGYVAYIADLGSAPSSRAGIQLHIADGNVGTGQDAFIVMRMEGSSAVVTNVMQFSGTAASKPSYFIATNSGGAASSNFVRSSITTDGTQDKVLVCNINSATYYIALYQAS